MVRLGNQSIRGLGNGLSLKSLKNLIPLLLILICTAACSGGDTEIEVIPEPEIVQEPIQEPEPVEEIPPEPDLEYFGTLESWGAVNGLIDVATDNGGNCIDPLLTTKAKFPKINAEVEEFYAPTLINGDTSCSKKLFNNIAKFDWDLDGKDEIVNPSSRIIFIKTHYSPDPEKRTSKNGDTEVIKSVLGGVLYAIYNEDSNEYQDRGELYDICGVGIDPRDVLEGDWQAIRTVTRDNEYKETRIEFCLRVSTLPGAVKCFVTEYEGINPSGKGVHGNWNDSIVLYAPYKRELDTEIISNSSTGVTLFEQVASQVDFPNSDRLCSLFDEGPKILGPRECKSVIRVITCGFGEYCPGNPARNIPPGQQEAEVLECKREEI